MENVMKVQEKKVGENAVSSSLKRAESQNSGKVESRLFTPHVASENERTIVNHQNYFRS